MKRATIELLDKIFTQNGSTSAEVVYLGTTKGQATIGSTIWYLISLRGVYYIAVCVVLLISLYYWQRERDHGEGLMGIICSFSILPLPISIVGLTRGRFFMAFLTIPLLSIGICKGLARTRYSDIILILSVVTMITLSPAVAFGYTPIHESSDGHRFQYVISEAESVRLSHVSDFSTRFDTTLTTFRITSYYVNYTGGTAHQEVNISNGNVILPKGAFLYRYSWGKYRASKHGDLKTTDILMSESYINHSIIDSNKIYSSGDVGLLWNEKVKRF
ncbi:hypothetical protein [Salinigranum marinum]|uniref:hypothetical protein n=1 Tax=Salinigranum marinum TaxID=1515595 RepID=UPI002989D3C2|nr:hypothetical protein [Salinigranum marinum]